MSVPRPDATGQPVAASNLIQFPALDAPSKKTGRTEKIKFSTLVKCPNAKAARIFVEMAERQDVFYAHQRKQWYKRHPGSVTYLPITDEMIATALDAFLETYRPSGDGPRTIDTKRSNNVLRQLRRLVKVDDATFAPCWFADDKSPVEPRDSLVVFADGVLNVETLLAGGLHAFVPHTPKRFITHALPARYQPRATCPKFEDFVTKFCSGDEERVRFIQEHMGWCLLPDTSHDVIVGFSGRKAGNGKSTICHLYRGVVGANNAATKPLDQFSDRFALENVWNRLINISPELEELSRKDINVLKAWTSDPVDVEPKGKGAFSVVPTARLIFSSNKLPPFESDRGLERRLVIINCDHSFIGDGEIKDFHLILLDEELEGIHAWALQGLQRLRERGHFIKPASSINALREHVLENDPVQAFLSLHTEKRADHPTSSIALYTFFKAWFRDNLPNNRFIPTAAKFVEAVSVYHGIAKPERKRFPGKGQASYFSDLYCEALEEQREGEEFLNNFPSAKAS